MTLLVPGPPVGGSPVPGGLRFAVETYPATRRPPAGSLLEHLRRGLPLQNVVFSYRHLEQRLSELTAGADAVVLQLVRLAGFLPAVAPATPLIVDLVDSLSLNFRLRAQRDRPWLAPLLRWEARRLAACEERLAAAAERTLLVADRDRRELAGRLPPALRSRLRTVPMVVEEGAARAGGRRQDTLVFSGNLGYFVNRDAVAWFLHRVWPRLREARPSLRFLCAGSRCPRTLRRRIEQGGAELIEDPPDMRRVLAEATIAVVPAQCGSGVPLKVLEAWAAGTPVVASPLAAQGVGNGDSLEVAATPAEWEASVLALLADADRRRAMAAAGRSRLHREHSVEAVSRRLYEALEGGLVKAV